ATTGSCRTRTTSTALAEAGERGKQLPGGSDTERNVLDEQTLVRRVQVSLRSVEAGDDRGNALLRQRGNDRKRPPGAQQERADAEHSLERFLTERDRGRVRRDQAGWRRGPELDLDLRPFRRRLTQQALDLRSDLFRPLPGGEANGDVRFGDDRD